MATFEVTILDVHDQKITSTEHKAATLDAARAKAVRKRFGKTAGFLESRSLAGSSSVGVYGEVRKPLHRIFRIVARVHIRVDEI